jgi:hypothetical protein
MEYHGGSGGYICCEFKVLVKEGGWFDGSGAHLADRRLVRNTTQGSDGHASPRPNTGLSGLLALTAPGVELRRPAPESCSSVDITPISEH